MENALNIYENFMNKPIFTHSLIQTRHGENIVLRGIYPLNTWVKGLDEYYFVFDHITDLQAKKYKKNKIYLQCLIPKIEIPEYPTKNEAK